MKTNLLLFDDRVGSVQKLADAATPSTDTLTFSYTDGLSGIKNAILAKIQENGAAYENVALVQHGSMSTTYSPAADAVADITEQSPYSSWAPIEEFLTQLASLGVKRFDFLACALYKHTNMAAIFTYLEEKTGLDLRASTNMTGNPENGGDWILESDNVDIRTTYFTDAIEDFKDVLGVFWSGYNTDIQYVLENGIHMGGTGTSLSLPANVYVRTILSNSTTTYALLSDGSIKQTTGSLSSATDVTLPTGRYATQIFIGYPGVAAILDDGSIYLTSGTLTVPPGTYAKKLVYIVNQYNGWVALLSDGTYITTIANSFLTPTTDGKKIKNIYAAAEAVCLLFEDGTIKSWGTWHLGGITPTHQAGTGYQVTVNQIRHIVGNTFGFMAIRNSGEIYAWGCASNVRDGNVTPFALGYKYYRTFSIPGNSWSLTPVPTGKQALSIHAASTTFLILLTDLTTLIGVGTDTLSSNTIYTFTTPANTTVVKLISTNNFYMALLSNGTLMTIADNYNVLSNVTPVSIPSGKYAVDIIPGSNHEAVVILNDGSHVVEGSATTYNIPAGTYIKALTNDAQSNIIYNSIPPYQLYGNRIYVENISSISTVGGFATQIYLDDITTVSNTTVINGVGNTLNLTAQVRPNNAINKKVYWFSSNTNVVDIYDGSNYGTPLGGSRARAINPGVAIVYAISAQYGLMSTIQLQVVDNSVTITTTPGAVSGISNIICTYPGAPNIRGIGKTLPLTAFVSPLNATNKTITWSSNNPGVATVDANGIVTSVAIGSATITATTQDGGYTATYGVNVTDPPVVTTNPTITATYNVNAISGWNIVNGIGATQQLYAYTYPSNATNNTVVWASSNPSIATVSSTGLVTTIAEGKTVITAMTAEGQYTTTFNMQVTNTVTGISPLVDSVSATSKTYLRTDASITFGTTSIQLFASAIAPSSAPDTSLIWTTSAASVATVNSSGLVTLQGAGLVTIRATTTVGGYQSNVYTITINRDPTGITDVTNPSGTTSTSLLIGQTVQLTATSIPNPTYPVGRGLVTWTSSNTSLATVSASGLVTAVGNGTVTITARTTSPVYSKTHTITVIKPVTSILTPIDGSGNTSITTSSTASTIQLTATVSPADASNKTLSWSSSNASVATVDSSGVVTLTGTGGSANITTSSNDGSNITSSPYSITYIVPFTSITAIANSSSEASTAFTSFGQTTTLAAAPNAGATLGAITWTSSNTAVATVDPSTGVVTAVANGSANIIATSGSITATHPVTVNIPFTSITAIANSSSQASTAFTSFGQTTTLAAAPNAGATVGTVTWTSSNAAIATVSSSGVVIAVANGSATITATSGSITATHPVTVNIPFTAISSVTNSSLQSSTTLTSSAATTTLTATPNAGATLGAVTWTSSNPLVATVSSSGVVTAVANGSATITATSGSITATHPVTVNIPFTAISSVTNSSLQSSTTLTSSAATTTLTATPNAGATLGAVTWTSSNTAVATVSSSGVVTAVANGSATITATSGSITATHPVTVNIPFTAISSVTNSSLQTSTTLTSSAATTTLTATPNAGATLGAVTWTSSNPLVATVSSSGVVTAVANGSATITVTSGSITATHPVTVNIPFTAISSVTNSSLQSSTTLTSSAATTTLTATPNAGATLGAVTWTSDNTAVATVDEETGVVTAVANGSATITATSDSITATHPVTVSIPFTAINAIANSSSEASTTFTVYGDTTTLAAAPNTGATLGTVTWTSSNTAVVTVDEETGVVTARGNGSATITATSGSITATHPVTVNIPFTSIIGIENSEGDKRTTLTAYNATTTLTAQPNTGATLGTVTWTSSNTAVATVNSSTGVVTAVGNGSAAITATSGSIYAIHDVTVDIPLITLTLTGTSGQTSTHFTAAGQTVSLTHTPNTGATLGTVSWTSSNISVATVSSNGIVAAVANGYATITATSDSISGTYPVSVTISIPAPAPNPSPPQFTIITLDNTTAGNIVDNTIATNSTAVTQPLVYVNNGVTYVVDNNTAFQSGTVPRPNAAFQTTVVNTTSIQTLLNIVPAIATTSANVAFNAFAPSTTEVKNVAVTIKEVYAPGTTTISQVQIGAVKMTESGSVISSTIGQTNTYDTVMVTIPKIAYLAVKHFNNGVETTFGFADLANARVNDIFSYPNGVSLIIRQINANNIIVNYTGPFSVTYMEMYSTPPPGMHQATASTISSDRVPCFPTGTKLLTPSGYKAVEALEKTDTFVTADGRTVTGKVYSRHIESATVGSAPYRIPANTFTNQPNELCLSPLHAFQLSPSKWEIPEFAAKRHPQIKQFGIGEPVTYYHVETADYFRDNLVAEGTTVESFGGNAIKAMPDNTPLYTFNAKLNAFTRYSPSKANKKTVAKK